MDKIDSENSNDPSGTNNGSASNGAAAGYRSTADIDDDVTAVVPRKTIATAMCDDRPNDLWASGLTNQIDCASGKVVTPELTEDSALEPGCILRDRFEIVALAHSGGMGHVYKALDRRRHPDASEQIHVAIKMMRRSVTSEQEAHLALEREAARTQRLSHPNIVNIYDFDQHEDQFYLVMEWLDGESINSLLRRTNGRPLDTQFALRLIHGIAAGLQHAHAHNVVHADVNPSNIFITDTQEIKLLDFGVARHVNAEESEEEDDSVVWATRAYASPEVLSGKTPTFADDIFSLGCIAYRALTGEHAFGQYSSLEARDAGFRVPPVPGLAAAHSQILQQALAYERSGRPASAGDLLLAVPARATSAEAGQDGGPTLTRWLLPAFGLVAILAVTGIVWMMQNGTGVGDWLDSGEGRTQVSAVANEIGADSMEAVTPPSELDVLLGRAAEALEEQRYLEPLDDNARQLFVAALVHDPENSVALDGLRAISDHYVQLAEEARRGDDPAAASAAISTAADTDPGNPSIAIVNELLRTKANGALTRARLAVAEGDAAEAAQALSVAESYAMIDAQEINAIRRDIAQGEQDREFLSRLAAADSAIATGRLVAPAEGNAHAILVELQHTYGTNLRVLESMERLGERLLGRAAFAIAADEFSAAEDALDAAATLGVLAADIAAAQSSLQSAIESNAIPEDDEVALDEVALDETTVVESDSIASTATDALEQLAPAEEGSDEFLLPGDDTTERVALMASTNVESVLVPPAVPGSAALPAADTALTALDVVRFSDLVIEKYVPPRVSDRVWRDEREGVVDVLFTVNEDGSTSDIEIMHSEPRRTFVPSATFAVKQWRFEERDDVVRAQVRMRFDWEDER